MHCASIKTTVSQYLKITNQSKHEQLIRQTPLTKTLSYEMHEIIFISLYVSAVSCFP